jgi:2,3-bisphosphoglycerate-dependent phosphoglycerate mutase
MARFAWCIALTMALVAPAATAHDESATAADSVTTLFMVRHAEKDTTVSGNDPPLSKSGLERANALARTLGHADISAVFVTEWQRTKLTAEPLAKAVHDTLHVLRGRDPAAQAARIRNEARGRTALVVGHSNTIPELVTALTGKPVPPIRDDEYDRLYVVVLYAGGSKVMWLNYGESASATK